DVRRRRRVADPRGAGRVRPARLRGVRASSQLLGRVPVEPLNVYTPLGYSSPVGDLSEQTPPARCSAPPLRTARPAGAHPTRELTPMHLPGPLKRLGRCIGVNSRVTRANSRARGAL